MEYLFVLGVIGFCIVSRGFRILTFVVVGAGPTGVELAGTIAELARDTLAPDFRKIDTQMTRLRPIRSPKGPPNSVPRAMASRNTNR